MSFGSVGVIAISELLTCYQLTWIIESAEYRVLSFE